MTEELQEAWGAFAEACQAVLDAAAELVELGAHPQERPHFPDAVTGCKSYLDRQDHQARIAPHQAEKAAKKAAQRPTRTYTLNDFGKRR